jgi:flagellar motor switch protein FliG
LSEEDARSLSAPASHAGCEFDDLITLDDDALARVFRAADPQVTLLALSGASADMAERILRRLPAKEAKHLTQQMVGLGAIRLRDVERAQQQLADLAWQLARQGTLTLPHARSFTVAA